MQISSYLPLGILIFAFPSLAHASCKDFDVQPPSFCVRMEVVDKRPTKYDSSAFKMKVVESKPLGGTFEFSSSQLKENPETLVAVKAGDFENLKSGDVIQGVLVKRCLDNWGFIDFAHKKLSDWVGITPPLAHYDIGKEMYVDENRSAHGYARNPSEASKKLSCEATN